MTSPRILIPSLTLATPRCPDVAPARSRVAAGGQRFTRMLRAAGAMLRFELTLSDQLLDRTGVGVSPRR